MSDHDDHLLEGVKKAMINAPFIDVIQCIPSYAKFLKGIRTPHRNPTRI